MLAALLYSGEVHPSLYGHCGTDIGNSGSLRWLPCDWPRSWYLHVTNKILLLLLLLLLLSLRVAHGPSFNYSPRSTF